MYDLVEVNFINWCLFLHFTHFLKQYQFGKNQISNKEIDFNYST